MASYKCWAYEYDDEWIFQNYPGRCTTEFFNAYCRHTGFEGNKETLRKHIRTLSDLNRKPFKEYTQEMDNWLIENYPKLGRISAINKFKEIFDVDYAWQSVAGHALHDLKLNVDKQVAYNNRHKFFDHQSDHLYKDGELREEGGSVKIKVNGKWMYYRRYLWEQENGKVPKGYRVTYLNDPYDFSMENTVCVPEKYITLLTSHKLRAENKTITKCGIKWCELYYTAVEQGLITPRKN